MSPDNAEVQAVILRKLDALVAAVQTLKPEPRLLTIQEAANVIGASKDTVRRMCDRREIATVQVDAGRAKRIALSDLQAWIDTNTVPPLRRL